ncbi:MAG: hypothetical protein Q9174_004727 [Haloplaca sp. 1 TL-2023]
MKPSTPQERQARAVSGRSSRTLGYTETITSMPPSNTAAEVALISLKNCLVNLPQSVIDIIAAINVPVQNVVVELQIQKASNTEAKRNGEETRRFIYAGWSGMPSSTKPTDPPMNWKQRNRAGKETGISTVEIDATFGRALGLTDGQKVSVSIHPDPPLAHTVNIEPLTPADWEIIELHANFLELNLLSQIRALPNPAFESQQAHLLTLHLSPTSNANIIVSSLVPSLSSSVPFARIAPDAEVIVAPKTHARRNDDEKNGSVLGAGRKSAGGRSGRSGASRRQKIEEPWMKLTLLLRPCDRRFCEGLFDDSEDGSEDEEDEERRNTGFKVWLDPDLLARSQWEKVNYVAVTIIRPPSAENSGNPQHTQQSRGKNAVGEAEHTGTLVARLLPWYECIDSSQASLSSSLCLSLSASAIVGGMVKLVVAPPPLPKDVLDQIIFSPFLPLGGEGQDVIRIGGEANEKKFQTLQTFQQIYVNPGSEHNLTSEPLTSGLIIPPSQEGNTKTTSSGGMLKIVSSVQNRSDSVSKSVIWVPGTALRAKISIGEEIPNPFSADKHVDIDDMLREAGPMIGVDRILQTLFSHLSLSASVLLSGGLGSGKTSLSLSLASHLRSKSQYHISYLSCSTLTVDDVRVSSVRESIERPITDAVWAVRLGGRALVVLDDIDKLCPAETELQTQDNGRSRQISQIICSMVRSHCSRGSGITLLATAQSKEALNALLMGANLFKEIVSLKAPGKGARRELLESLAGSVDTRQRHTNGIHKLRQEPAADDRNNGAAWMDDSQPSSPIDSPTKRSPNDEHLDLLDIAGRTDGYMPADIALLVSRAKSEALIRSVNLNHQEPSAPGIALHQDDFILALKDFVPATLRNVPLQSSTTSFSSIGGLKATRQTLLETLQYPTLYAPIFAQCSLRLRSGILLYGYPGCGKTLLASAIAGECGLNFISVKGPEILNKYIGASEKGVRDLFDRAESARPCVLFFDEFDSIAPKRGHDSTGVTDRVVNQLLTQMDGAEGLSGVYVLAATSRPDLIDPALLRPGRLDKSILCDLPDLEDRVDILGAVSRKLKLDSNMVGQGRHSLHEVAERTEGYTGADLQAIVYNAHLEAIHEKLGDGKDSRKNGREEGQAAPSRKHRSDILQFPFDPQATPANQTNQKADYNTALRKVDGLRQAKRNEKHKHLQPPGETYAHGNPQNSKIEDEKKNEVVIQWHHIEASLASTRKSISAQERERLRGFYQEFVVARKGEMPDGLNSTEVGGRSSLM